QDCRESISETWKCRKKRCFYRILVFHRKSSLVKRNNSDFISPQKIKKWTGRSEEHTSELQSRFDIVCRLLLEKKKKKNNILKKRLSSESIVDVSSPTRRSFHFV